MIHFIDYYTTFYLNNSLEIWVSKFWVSWMISLYKYRKSIVLIQFNEIQDHSHKAEMEVRGIQQDKSH